MLDGRHIAHGPIGAQPGPAGVYYRVWAPDARKVCVHIDVDAVSRAVGLSHEDKGFWSATDFAGATGDRYRFKLDDRAPVPDVASRFQPEGIDGPSECIDPTTFAWECVTWTRPGWHGQTTYEIHVGTATREGTFRSLIPHLGLIRELGAEAIELMPVADFAGNRNWGYDGVSLFAPARCYGRPDDLRALVDAAHSHGLAVILDVVYNHIGPQGGHFDQFSEGYFLSGNGTPWGRGFNLDGPRGGPVREFLKSNVAYWLDDFRFDGLRLDATHAITDSSPSHLIREIAELAHSRGAFVVAEDERNTTSIQRTLDGGGLGVDAAWADDFHHQVRVSLTGTRKTYFAGFEGKPSDIADTIRGGWTYHGQSYLPWNGEPRGEPADFLEAESFIYCIENHDQVGNRALGERLEHLVDPARFRAASMLLCLNPHPVLLFMGQEWAASSPFLYFCNHGGELGRNISKGRQKELEADGVETGIVPPDPEDPSTFEKSKLCWDERTQAGHAPILRLYESCLRERQSLRASGAFRKEAWSVRAEGPLIAVRYHLLNAERLLLVNQGDRSLFPESLSGPFEAPAGQRWHVRLDSEAREFGGAAPANREKWTLHGPGALWLEAKVRESNGTH